MDCLFVRELTSSRQPERRCHRGQLEWRKRVDSDPASEAALLPPNREKFLVLLLGLSNSTCLCRGDNDSETLARGQWGHDYSPSPK